MSIPRPDGPNVDIGPSMLATCWTLYSIAGLVVVGRVYTQIKIIGQFGIGDIFMICAVIFGFAHIGFLTASHHYGLGRHFFYLSDSLKVKASMWEFIAEPFGPLCSMCGRTSFIILMIQLFGTTKLRVWFLYFLIAQTIVINLVTCITIYTQCENVVSTWDPVGTPSKCWNPSVQADIGFFQGATNSLTDLILTILPLTIFWKLQMNLRLKIGLAALLSLSVFAFASSIVKTVKLKSLGDREDYTWNTVPFMNWVVIENTFVIIGASIPLMRPLFNKAKKQAMSAYWSNTVFEMNSRGQGGTNRTGTKGPFSSAAQHKSIALQSSSEENILQLVPVQGSGNKSATDVVSNKQYRHGQDAENGIMKVTTVQVKYDESDGIATPPKSKWGYIK